MDIREMISSGIGSSDAVTVLLATGGASRWNGYGFSPQSVQYHRLNNTGPVLLKDAGRMSMGSAKGQGFSGDILLNIYAPAGTKMMYAEPFSAYGGGEDLGWDGKRKQSAFGREFETIMQQGTQFRITKVEKSGGQLYVDIEVINQDKQQRYKGR